MARALPRVPTTDMAESMTITTIVSAGVISIPASCSEPVLDAVVPRGAVSLLAMLAEGAVGAEGGGGDSCSNSCKGRYDMRACFAVRKHCKQLVKER
ncbi:hypothetical protein PoB_002388600 [Plakobranchus ocellatus]|uniref:Uncharacterized protein n=1 Tax=Plakobranchus ocellatus TaxID=259542 RepID=A0AAV3ZN76_9GAST|nr:hypothetical protein PoB_002388600 [Plakobranchus ocellatus]